MTRKVLITMLVIGLLALIARVLINPAIVSNLAVSPALKTGETILINRAERFSGKPLQRFELVAIVPPFINGRPYEADESPGAVIADITGLPVGNAPLIDVRRIIALPGETVVIRKDLGIFIDGKLLDETSYTKDAPDCDIFVLADITRESALAGVVQPYQNGDSPIVVPPDMVFVLPDNRKDFSGSEKWGFLSQKRVLGKVAYKLATTGIVEMKTPALVFATEKIAINDDGVRALDKGEYTKAIHLFKSALAIDNNFELARDNLSIAYNNFAIQSANRPDIALDSLHKALFLDPDNALTKKNLAGILARMGKNENSYKDRVELAEAAAKAGQSISALVEYRAAVKLNPNPTILAKVSELEAQCNFPAQAIPETLVTTTADNTTPESKNSEEPRTEIGEPRADTPGGILKKLSKQVAHEPAKSSGSKKPVETADSSAKPKASTQHSAREKTDDKELKKTASTQSDKDSTVKKSEKQIKISQKEKPSSLDKSAALPTFGSADAPASFGQPDKRKSLEKVAKSTLDSTTKSAKEKEVKPKSLETTEESDWLEKAATTDSPTKTTKNESIDKTSKTFDKSAKSESLDKTATHKTDSHKSAVKEIEKETASTEKLKDAAEATAESKHEPGSKGKSTSKHKVADKTHTSPAEEPDASQPSEEASKPSDKAKKIAVKPETAQKEEDSSQKPGETLIQSRPLKKKDNGFDFGAIMQNIVSAISPSKGNTENPKNVDDYRGPPLLKKHTP